MVLVWVLFVFVVGWFCFMWGFGLDAIKCTFLVEFELAYLPIEGLILVWWGGCGICCRMCLFIAVFVYRFWVI